MDGMPLRFFKYSAFALTVATLSACGSAVNTEKTKIPGPTYSSDNTTTTPDPGTVVNSLGFFLNITNTTFTSILHEADNTYGSTVGTTNFTTDCKISDDGNAVGTDLFCVAEVQELDLYFNTLTLQYHVPSNMCTYFRLSPYYFYSYEPGSGPSQASHDVLANGTIVDNLNTVNGEPYCNYDYRSASGPNCCIGSYTDVTVTYASDGSFVRSQSTKSWGGAVSNCLQGPAMTTQVKSTNGFPRATVYYVSGTGINDIYTMTHSLSQISSNVYTANFYNLSDNSGSKPISLQAPAAVSDSALQIAPNDTYDFQCLDKAREIKSRIRLMIREWNTADEFHEGGNPDETGTEPNFPGQSSNDHLDWKDFGNTYPASNL